MISDYYRIEVSEQIASFDKEKSKLDKKEVERRILLARAYNDALNNNVKEDSYDKERKKKGIAEYARILEINEKIGDVQIPPINIDIPIYAKTSEEILQKPAGHLERTSLPIGGKSRHSVITVHRGLPSARLFTDLDKLEKGDKFYIHMLDEVLAYRVDRTLTLEPTNFAPVLVVEGEDYSSLLTCTPYGINSTGYL